jgi:hypothetical protein
MYMNDIHSPLVSDDISVALSSKCSAFVDRIVTVNQTAEENCRHRVLGNSARVFR